ncbi:SDR family NAD(P)-dependent oxidoreductase [Flammeovirga agarivorans]|uniref:SDR family oxidoreductase n=1 Tax=Flammeovirga agarivorans TaxID=2726742 RepID=A0A7X8SGG3_9BACT|nr:SDR family oxidoreductase [Flammeovirga agarivorans]NLR89770.1 SDR family oxidoreductase [Flammeovirga agarivorans]
MSQKLAVIVGYGKAVGNVVLEALLECDFSVALISRNQENLDAYAKEYQNKGFNVKGFAHDISNLEGIPNTLDKITEEMGKKVDLCYFNVAQFVLPFDASIAQIQAGININYGALWTSFTTCLPHWEKENSGIFMMSGGSLADNGAYSVGFNAQFGSAAKSFIKNFAESMNATFNDKGIHIVDLKISNLVFGGVNIPDAFNETPEEAAAFRKRVQNSIVEIIKEPKSSWKSTYPVE